MKMIEANVATMDNWTVAELRSLATMLVPNCLLVLCVAWPPSSTALNYILKKETFDLAGVTLLLARDHLSKFSSTVVIAEYSSEPETSRFNAHFMDYLLLHLNDRIAVQLDFGTIQEQHWDHYIFIVDSLESLRVLVSRFPVNYFEREFYFLIVLTKYTPNYREVMKQMFKLCYEFQVINANIIIDHPKLGVSMFSYKLFTKTGCHVIQPELFFKFKEGISQWNRLFPQKLMNFYGCPMKVTSRHSPPILIFEGNLTRPKPKGNWDNLSGIEGSVLKFVAQELNFTIDLLPFPKASSNSTLNACFLELIDGKADIAVGAFSASDRNRLMISPTQSYHTTPYMYVVRGELSLSALDRLRKPFASGVWVFIGFLLTAGAVVISLVRCMRPTVRRFVFGGTHVSPMANLFGVFLGYSVVRPPRGVFARYILTLWLLLSLVIRNAYQGALYDAFRWDKFVWTPAGYDDLLNWNYKIIVSSDMAQTNTLSSNQLVGGDYIQRLQMLEQRHRKYATVVLQDSYLDYISKAYRRGSDLVMINEVIYMYQVVMYLPKHSIYVSAINKMLSAFAYSGMGRYFGAHSRSQADLLNRYKEKPPKRPLSMKRLNGPFKIYLALLILAVVVFVLELVSVYCRPLRGAFEWLAV